MKTTGPVFYRVFNEVPVLILFQIVLLVYSAPHWVCNHDARGAPHPAIIVANNSKLVSHESI